MSTRSQTRFEQHIEYENDDGTTETVVRSAQVYRHSDGYPSGVLPSLAQLKALQDETGTERDPSYVAANLIFLNKLQGMGLYLDRDGFGGSISAEDIVAVATDNDVSGLAELNQPHFLLGYGVEDTGGIHGDENYIYVVELPNGDPFEDGRPDWHVKVSESNGFPRWKDNTDEAYEQATWQFEGPLIEAIEEFC